MQDLSYPRPQLRRADWISLDGPWRFAFDGAMAWRIPRDVREWPHTIEVPFAPECERSGIGDPAFTARAGTSATSTSTPNYSRDGRRLILHFGAVDYHARVWVNDTGRRARGRPHAVLRRHHVALRADGPQTRDRAAPRTIRTTWRSRAASRTGSSSRTPSGIRAPPASGRRCGSRACRAPTSQTLRWTPTSSAARSPSSALHRRARPRDDLRIAIQLASRRARARRRHATR